MNIYALLVLWYRLFSDPLPIEMNESAGASSCARYPSIVGLDCELFQLTNTPLSNRRQRQALGQLERYLKEYQSNLLGYQVNQNLHYAKQLAFMLDIHTNNVGDPFDNANYALNTKTAERAVLDYFAKLWHAPVPSDPANKESYWGYVLTMGSTEGNLFGLYNARDYLKGRALYQEASGGLSSGTPQRRTSHPKHAYHPVAFFSEDSHYSIIRAVRILDIRTFYEIGVKHYQGKCPITSDGQWPREVPSRNGTEGPGSIDVDKLIRLVEFFAQTGSPPLIVLNVGTSFKGAYDDVEEIGNRLKKILKKYGLYERRVEYAPGKFDQRTGYWIHVDGALGATYLPFLAKAPNRIKEQVPKFDFSLPFVQSIVTSAHKYPGCPMPSGIYMTRRKYQLLPPDDPDIIGAPDTTFAGSRNAMAPVVLWQYYANTNDSIEIEKAVRREKISSYAENRLKALDQDYQTHGHNIWVARSPLSLAIIFRDPDSEDIVMKYSLAQEELEVIGEPQLRKYVHIYIMGSVRKRLIDELIDDLRPAYDKLFLLGSAK